MEGLSTICAGLGNIEDDDNGNRIGYSKDDYCLDNLKDLLRFLRRDDPQKREVFKQVCKWNIAGKDLIPIIEYCQDDRNLVLNSVKVLVFLTMPIEPSSSDIPQQIEYIWGLKHSITCSDTAAVIMTILESPLENLDREAFTEDDWKLVQLVLTLFRNILAVQDISTQQKAQGSATQFLSLRDRFLELLFKENVMDLILVLSQHVGDSRGYLRHDNLLLLETFHYIFMGQEPELIAKANLKGSKGDVDSRASLNSLKSIMEEEEEKRKLTRLRNLSCYSQFSGTFTRLTMDGSKTLFKGNPCSASCDTLLKAHKNHRGPSKRTMWDHGRLPSTKDNILKLLHDFVNQFLSGGYNVLMQSICENIEKEHHSIQSSDIVVFFQVAQFVTSFQYHKVLILKPNIEDETLEDVMSNDAYGSTRFKGSICGPIAASMNESMFLLVILKWRNAFDALKETNDYKFISAAGSLMKIMIRMLDLVLKQSPEDSKEAQTARVLLYKLFYDQTDQGMTQFLLNLIKSFNTHKQSKSDLADLTETIHVIVRLTENLQARGTLRVSRKSRKKRAKKALNNKKDDVNAPVGDHVTIQNGIGVSPREPPVELSMSEKEPLRHPGSDGKEEEDIIIPVHSNGPETSELQMENPGSNIAEAENKMHDAISVDLHCGTDEVSMLEKETLGNPSSDGNGKEDIVTPMHTNEPETSELEMANPGSHMSEVENKTSDDINDDLQYGTDDSSGDEQLPVIDEVDFKVSTLVSSLANNNVVQNLCWLLKFYKSNSTSTNHYIISILQRVCDDLALSPILYQLSLLTTFYDILVEQKSNPCKEHENVVCFLTSLVRRMLKKMKSYPLLFVEVLFWKTRKECHYISCESLLNDLGNLKGGKKRGSVARDENIGSSEGTGWVRKSIADALGEDEADVIMSQGIYGQKGEGGSTVNFGEGKESVTSVLNDGMVRKGSSDNEWNSVKHESGRVHKRRKLLGLNSEMDGKIKDLYEKYKDDQNCSHLIAEDLDLDGKVSALQVSKKLKQMGFKIPRKKRKLHAGGSKQLVEEQREVGSGISRPDSNDLEDSSSLRRPLHTRKRVHAFSEDQELMIKALFEQFKDHKRCSYMIANALDAGGTYSASQVSRKLKQLGLCVPRRKRSDVTLHLQDEDLNDFKAEIAVNSDNETLLSLRRRSKNNQNESDSEERLNKKTGGTFSEDDSDDEFLSSVVERKTRKSLRKMDDEKLKTTSIKDDLGYEETQDVIERDANEQPMKLGAIDIDNDTHSNAEDIETELAEVTSGKQFGFALDDKADHLQHQQLYDDLADSGDDSTPIASRKDVVSRRKSRMVIDLEDDE